MPPAFPETILLRTLGRFQFAQVHEIPLLRGYISSIFNKWDTCRIIPLTAGPSGLVTLPLILRRPNACIVFLCFGIAPIVDFTKVIFKSIMALLS